MPTPRTRPELTEDFLAAMSPEFRALMAARSDDRKHDPNTDEETDDALLAAALIGCDE